MSNIAMQRIQRECREVATAGDITEAGIHIELVDNSMVNIKGIVKGPDDTPYAGGQFEIQIEIPEQYPFQPPKAKFVTRIWHPNISSQTGAICLDILKDKWAASLTLRTVLLSIQAMLCSPEPNDPQDAVVAKQYLDNPSMYKTTAIFWTVKFAGARHEVDADYTKKVNRLVEMGVRDTDAIGVLSCNNWIIDQAVHYIFC